MKEDLTENTREELTIDGSNQYEPFYLEEEPLQSGMSFPVSENSMEAHAFKSDFAKILSYLRGNQIAWQSVECVGRLSERKKI